MLLYSPSADGAERKWVWEAKGSASKAREARTPRWKVVHGELRSIATRRAMLDAEEARWLREAETIQIWAQFGMVSMIDYLERVCGYAPKTGHHRMRVARALGALPVLSDALATGDLSFSAVRELVRVATPATESEWLAAARGKNIRQLEEMVSGHRPGDRPDDPAEPDARLHTVALEEVDGAAYALYRQARARLHRDHGGRLSDSDVLRAFASAILAMPDKETKGTGADKAVGHSGRASFQIAYTVCRLCDRAVQEGGGVSVPVNAAALAQARCDAQHIGNIDGDGPQRAVQDIPPATVRFIRRRDREACQTPGCRSTLGLQIHHIVAREQGGSHDPSNLTLRCSACHHAHHDGKLRISGTAPDRIITERDVPYSSPRLAAVTATPVSRYSLAVLRTEAMSAIRELGWSAAIAKSVVDAAIEEQGPTATLEDVLRAAIQRTPRPTN